MIITNNYNLPKAIYNAITKRSHDPKGDISTTQLIYPPRVLQLLKRHNEIIIIDASEMLWSLLGWAIHKILEEGATLSDLSEERMPLSIHGWMLTGQPDLYYLDDESLVLYILDDYKVTSYWSYVFGREEWHPQMNVNAYIYSANGFDVDKAFIRMILRDHTSSKIGREPGYPEIPFVSVEIPLWGEEKQWDYISKRIIMHQEAVNLPDKELPLCTPEERWYRGEEFAVMKPGKKRADRKFDTWEEANEWVNANGTDKHTIVLRPGTNNRCERYCQARSICDFALNLKKLNDHK